jgi:hypothetical protein
VIHDVDATLKELLLQKMPLDPASVDISFDMPSRDWAARIVKPTINLFLYDVRENHELRSNERTLVRNEAGTVGTERRAPVRMDLTYLITAWTSEVSDEHQLLGGVLTTLLRSALLPDEVLKGLLRNQAFPIRTWLAQPERTPNPWDFWGNMESRMKAGLNFVLTTAFEPFEPADAKLVKERILDLNNTATRPTVAQQ